MNAEHKPSVGMSGIQDIKDSTNVIVTFQNAGKAPAFGVRIAISAKAQGLGAPTVFKTACVDDCRISDFEMLPNVPLGFRVPRSTEPEIPIGAIQRIVIRVDYVEEDGTPHKTGICLLKSATDLASCPEPNSNYAE